MGYEAEMAALSLACCSPGSEVTAAWKSAVWCWAKSFISMANVFWVSVGERQTKSLGMRGKHGRLMTKTAILRQNADESTVQGVTEEISMRGNIQLSEGRRVSAVLCCSFVSQ